MKLISSLSIDRVAHDSGQHWQLVVAVWQAELRPSVVLAIGVEPDLGRVVFELELPRELLGTFLKAVVDGDRKHPDQLSYHQLVRKTTLAFARSLRADARLADAVVAPPEPAKLDKPSESRGCD
jgi:hypothetical protein